MKHSLSIKIPFILIVSLLVSVISAQDTPAITIRLAILPVEDIRDILYAQVARFVAETGIQVEIDDFSGGLPYQERTEILLEDGLFDVVYADNDMLDRWVTAGYLLPVDGQIADEADFYPSVLDSVRVNGSLYCIPRSTWSTVLFYNRDSFDTAGLAYPTDEWTWDDLHENSQLLLEANSEPLLLDPEINNWLPFLYQAGDTVTNSQTGTWAFNSLGGLEALTLYLDLYQTGRTNIEIMPWGGWVFIDKRAGMTLQGTWLMRLMMEYDTDVNWGAVELPSHHTEGAFMATQCYGVFANTQHHEASLLLANYLTNAQSQTDLFSFYELPARKSLSDAYITHWVNVADENGWVWHEEDIQTFFDSLQHGFSSREFRAGRYTYPALTGVFSRAFHEVLEGDITPEEMLNRLDEAIIANAP
jgi:ABC-type glycerol-3-phosphate transport system substrate-binding protein